MSRAMVQKKLVSPQRISLLNSKVASVLKYRQITSAEIMCSNYYIAMQSFSVHSFMLFWL